MPTISAVVLTEFTRAMFTAVGVPPEDATVVAEGLIGANLRGHDSHGVMRVPQYIEFVREGHYRLGVDLIVEHETAAAVTCNGQWGFGQVQAHRLLGMLMPKAQTLGIAAGTARHCGHIGRLGEYAERAAKSGIALIATVNNNGSGQRVAPPGGLEGRLGTNPLCVGIPTEDGPVVLDFGTSVAAEGKVRVYAINEAKTPDGWLFDSEGNPTNDPNVLYRTPFGTLRPMGGDQAYKGFGLALVLDMLAGGLTGGRMAHEEAPPARGNNVVFLALDPGLFAGRDALIEQATALAGYVRGTPRAEGVEAILIPGDPERIILERRQLEGIPIAPAHWSRLAELAGQLGVTPPA